MSDCICTGNWRNIIKEVEPLMGKTFIDVRNGNLWVFQGVLWVEDDFYYVFINDNGHHKYITCCASFEQSGMKLYDEY